jgi:uncharacterized protein DUF3455
MRYISTKRIISIVAMLTFSAIGSASVPDVQAGGYDQPPDLPASCEKVQVDAGHKVAFHVYAIGVQIYRWNGTSWDFVAPQAALSSSANYDGDVGSHYAGPTWESNSGSKVVARRKDGCTPDANAIPWLLLEQVSTSGPGIFSSVTYIQRVNTTGGLPPTTPGLSVGEISQVPYTAEYYFYRQQD